MSGQELLRDARRLGVVVTLDGNELVVRGPKAALTPDFLQRLRERKEVVQCVLASLQRPDDGLAKVRPPIASPCATRPLEERIRVVQEVVGGGVLSKNHEGFSLVCDGQSPSDLESAIESLGVKLNAAVVGKGKYGFQVCFRFRDPEGRLHGVYAHISFSSIRHHEMSSPGGPGE